MTYRILVAYASKYGSTAEIAKKIGAVLSEAGLAVDILPAGQVPDVTSYDAVVLGSAVYAGNWRIDAVTFLDDYKALLRKIPLWLFSSGPVGEGDSNNMVQGWHFPPAQQSIADRVHARDIVLFSGAIDLGKLDFIEKQIVKEFGTLGGDFRDWEAITNWGQTIAISLRPEVAE